MIGYEVVTL